MTVRFPFSTEVRVRFRDVDMMRHVNNAVYLSYLEEARSDFWEFLFGQHEEFRRASFIIARITINYRAPAFFREKLVVSIGVREVGNSSFTFLYEIRKKETGELVADGESVQVMYRYREGKPYPIPEEMRKIFLEKGMVEEDPGGGT
ncbi:MAG: acyl-CoA thioesterase [Deltaproteobacteria bacterium]|nr:MAG: acyl-CoA thioesterase [Deltaproteobacteria bacterium]